MSEPIQVLEAHQIAHHLHAAASTLPPALTEIVQQQSKALAEDIRLAFEARNIADLDIALSSASPTVVQGIAVQLLVLWDATQRVAGVAALNLGVDVDDFVATARQDFAAALAALDPPAARAVV